MGHVELPKADEGADAGQRLQPGPPQPRAAPHPQNRKPCSGARSVSAQLGRASEHKKIWQSGDVCLSRGRRIPQDAVLATQYVTPHSTYGSLHCLKGTGSGAGADSMHNSKMKRHISSKVIRS